MESLHLHRGFTLIELLVVTAIITFIMTIALTSQSTFNKTLILQNTAYDIALTLRSAQTFGLGSRAQGATANAGYGVYFQRALPAMVWLFADIYPPVGWPTIADLCHTPPAYDSTGPNALPGNCTINSAKGEKVQTYTLGNGITVSDFCARAFNGSWSCGLASLNIVFARPNPDAFIKSGTTMYSSACLKVTSPQGGARFITVGASGEITANAPSDPSSCHE